MKYLAIGVYYEENAPDGTGFTASIAVDTDEQQEVINAVAAHNENGVPNEILLVQNVRPAPKVIKIIRPYAYKLDK